VHPRWHAFSLYGLHLTCHPSIHLSIYPSIHLLQFNNTTLSHLHTHMHTFIRPRTRTHTHPHIDTDGCTHIRTDTGIRRNKARMAQGTHASVHQHRPGRIPVLRCHGLLHSIHTRPYTLDHTHYGIASTIPVYYPVCRLLGSVPSTRQCAVVIPSLRERQRAICERHVVRVREEARRLVLREEARRLVLPALQDRLLQDRL